MSDTWRAWLADGREFSEGSPFRMLQGMGEIVLVEARLGLRVVALEADGHPLVTGLVGCWLFNEGSGGSPDYVDRANSTWLPLGLLPVSIPSGEAVGTPTVATS